MYASTIMTEEYRSLDRLDTNPSMTPHLPVSDGSQILPILRHPAVRDRPVLFQLSGAEPGALFSISASGTVIGRAESSHIIVDDGAVSWEHTLLTAKHASVYVEDLRSLNGTFVNDQRIEREELLVDGDQLRLGGSSTIFKFSMMGEFEETVMRNLCALTLRDALTHLFNQRYFDDQLRREVSLAVRQETVLSLLVIDIDQFKAVNARFGRHAGDVSLKLVAGTLQKLVRPDDLLVRLEGGKFAIVLHATSPRNALILGERVCHRVAALSLEAGIQGLALTVSAGVASFALADYAESADDLLTCARDAAREANVAGGNRVFVATRV